MKMRARLSGIVSLNMRTALLFVALLTFGRLAIASESVVLGVDLSQTIIKGVQTPCVNDGELICNGVWVRWKIRTGETLSGPSISGRITAAMVQHGLFVSSRKLFVLKPIDDPEVRKMLGANYFLEEFSTPREMYCLDKKPESLDGSSFSHVDSKGGGPYCFERPESN